MAITLFFVFISILVPLLIVCGIVYLVLRGSRRDESEKKRMLTPKELAVELGMFLALAVSVFTFVIIAFAIIDRLFPDILNDSYYYTSQALAEQTRLAIAAILVAFPIYLALAWTRARHFVKHIERREVGAFKWQHYVALFLSAIFAVSTLITVLYNYLNGEVTEAALFKAALVLILSLVLGAYYYYSLRRDYTKKTPLPLTATLLSIAAVLGLVFYSFSVFGTPAEVRKVKFDEKRLENLSTIQQSIVSHWQTNYTLPENLSMLEDKGGLRGGITVPTDPKTGEVYTYTIIENSTMNLTSGQPCISFYPGKYSTVTNITTVTCQIPTAATFEICANFETVRAYDENGIDRSGMGEIAVGMMSASDAMSYRPVYYYPYDKQNPSWNHAAEYTCFSRTINPTDFPSYY